MKKSRKTKRVLIPSILAVILCVAMLVGTTFAWFTDTASTSVNKIQAGTLDVALEMKNANDEWVSAEGKTLEFKKASTESGTEVLWEPGCTYSLPELRIRNNGNLALKYKVVITGIEGSAELNDVIDWTIKNDAKSGAADLSTTEYNLTAKDGDNDSDILTISGTMKTTAGNEYQGKSIDNIAITVYATQLASEYDSIDNTYDSNAVYSALISVINETTTATKTGDSTPITISSTVSTSAGGEETTETTAVTTIPANAQIASATKVDATAGETGTTITEKDIATGDSISRKLQTTEATADSVTYDISFIYTQTTDGTSTSYNVSEFSAPVTNVIQLSSGLANVTVTHSHGNKTTKFTQASSADNLTDDHYYYDATTGKLTICSSKYSSFKIGYENDFTAAVGGQGYNSFAEAVKAAKDGQTITLQKDDEVKSTDYNQNVGNRLTVAANNVTIDLCGNTLTVPNYTLILDGDNITLKNGEMTATTTDSTKTYGSYAVVPWGKNIIIDNVEMLGGINVTGNNSGNAERDTTVTIRNCEITATNYYTVCAQSNAEATIENCKLIGGKGTFFWVEEKGYSEGDAPLAEVSSKIIYDAKTVEFEGNNDLYNPVGVAVVAKNLTVKDAEGHEKTIDAVAVSTEKHLETLVAAGENVMLASDITLSANTPLAIDKSITIVGNGHKLIANYTEGKGRVINIESPNEAGTLSDITLTLSGVDIVGPTDNSYNRGVSAWGIENLTIIMDNCSASANHYALNIAGNNKNAMVIVRNTTLTGYSAFQTWSENTTATFENCTLIGVNKWSGSTDDYATIVLLADKASDAKNSKLTFRNCTIKAVEDGTANERLLDARTAGANVTFDNCKFFVNDTEVTGDAIKSNMKTLSDTTLTIN